MASQIPDRDPQFKDFRNFLAHVWAHLGLPPPTPVQFDIAYAMQHGDPRLLIEGYRGVGKSWITAAFVGWTGYWNPNAKILIVSGAKRYADDMSTFILQIIRTVPGLDWLDCDGRDRASKIAFDFGPAEPHKQPSVTSLGITGQLAGSRANLIVADDIETLSNALTQAGRDKVNLLVQEFDSIILPGGRILFLGTPQTEQSIYLGMPAKGFQVRIWPAHYPDQRLQDVQASVLAPMILDRVREDPGLVNQPTDPARFGVEDLASREASIGRSGYAMQFRLDTSYSDLERYPLKLRDLICYPCQDEVFPSQIQWDARPDRVMAHLPVMGMGQDRLYGPLVNDNVRLDPWQGCVMYVDPAGTGKDETAYCIMRHQHGRLAVPECTGLSHNQGGFSDAVMTTLAKRALRFKVGIIQVESNFGDGMFEKLLLPHVRRVYEEAGVHPPAIEGVKVSTQKELRILSVLEPLMNQHKLVVDPEVFARDNYRAGTLPAEQAPRYTLQFQLTRLTTERGCLAHDDRIDAMAGAALYWQNQMILDSRKSVAKKDLELLNARTLKETAEIWGLGRKDPPKTLLLKNAGVRASRTPGMRNA
jgi:hypothetical protein